MNFLTNILTVAKQIATDRAKAEAVAAQAGARGMHATPLDDRQRIDNYWRQNGHEKGLTPKQRRRAEHKASRAFYRQPADA